MGEELGFLIANIADIQEMLADWRYNKARTCGICNVYFDDPDVMTTFRCSWIPNLKSPNWVEFHDYQVCPDCVAKKHYSCPKHERHMEIAEEKMAREAKTCEYCKQVVESTTLQTCYGHKKKRSDSHEYKICEPCSAKNSHCIQTERDGTKYLPCTKHNYYGRKY